MESDNKPKLFVSFSAGQSSAFMAQKLSREYRHLYEMVFGFANTGQENEKSLVFADRCDREFGLNLVWMEAVTHYDQKMGCTHKIVDFASASRKEEPFREMIKKYGIPNKAYPHCTRELKENPLRSYLASIGWETGNYIKAIGMRVDEPKRRRADANKVGIVYPLMDWFPMTKPEINAHWDSMPFCLGLEEHEGNCKTCWKKSFNKLVRIARETPAAFEFNAEMEAQYGLAGYNEDGTKRVFFRGNMSTLTLLSLAAEGISSEDHHSDMRCSESCEPFV